MGSIGQAIDRYWTWSATLALVLTAVISSGVALDRDRPGVVVTFIGLSVTLLVGLWTVELLRRDLRLRTRPYLAVVSNEAYVDAASGKVLIVPHLRVAGDYPAVVTAQTATIEGNGSSEFLPGTFEQNIIYPNETVQAGRYLVPPGGVLDIALNYADLPGRRNYRFGIVYSVGQDRTVSIRGKTAD